MRRATAPSAIATGRPPRRVSPGHTRSTRRTTWPRISPRRPGRALEGRTLPTSGSSGSSVRELPTADCQVLRGHGGRPALPGGRGGPPRGGADALDAAGNVYVTDTASTEILVLRAGSTELETLVPKDKFVAPSGIVASEDGKHLWVADVVLPPADEGRRRGRGALLRGERPGQRGRERGLVHRRARGNRHSQAPALAHQPSRRARMCFTMATACWRPFSMKSLPISMPAATTPAT
jgi:hypothetical protein